jgi:hypothetical protein
MLLLSMVYFVWLRNREVSCRQCRMQNEAHGGKDTGVLLDALMGAAAGAAAVWVMDRVDWFMFEHEDPQARLRTQAVRPGGKDPAHTIAGQAAHAMGKEFSDPQQNAAGMAIHYNMGVGPGALYGAMRDRVGGIGAARGLAYGVGLFVLQDEGLNALTGISARPRQYPWQAHARGLVAHVVYGLVLDSTFSLMKKWAGAKASPEEPEQTATGIYTGGAAAPAGSEPHIIHATH